MESATSWLIILEVHGHFLLFRVLQHWRKLAISSSGQYNFAGHLASYLQTYYYNVTSYVVAS